MGTIRIFGIPITVDFSAPPTQADVERYHELTREVDAWCASDEEEDAEVTRKIDEQGALRRRLDVYDMNPDASEEESEEEEETDFTVNEAPGLISWLLGG